MLSLVRTLATVFWKRFICLLDGADSICSRIPSTSRRAYQTSMFLIFAKCAIAARYSRVIVITTERRIALLKPRSRPATAKLAASRLTSHSNGPGSVSSKSLMPKTSLRSGAAQMPKLARCASPQSWACSPVRGPAARSAAIG
jgi:hypothetical protein